MFDITSLDNVYIIIFFSMIAIIFFVLIFLPIVFDIFFSVEQQSAAILERFGRFLRIGQPGLNIKIPFIDRVAGRINLRVRQLDVNVETKTKDDVFVKIIASVQYRILPEKIYEAFYILENVEAQIEAFVFDVVRARVPSILLDDVFSRKDEIADSVKAELKEVMNDFGYDIVKTLVTDIHPDAKVKAAMNEINEAQRLRLAAIERGEAERILKVKQAEAESESKVLQGKGMAGQRAAIIEGLKESLGSLQEVHDTSTRDVMELILMIQYFDTLKEMGVRSNTNTILLPHSPAALQDMQQQIREAIIAANQVPTK